MSQPKQSPQEGEERFATLQNNAGAVRAICSAVEGTLGPKGLDTMLVGSQGDVLITNDGVTILEKMDASHPAARLVIQVARAQQERVGDGTTTATVIAGALVQEGVAQVLRGVPPAKVAQGIQEAVRVAVASLSERTRSIASLDDPMLRRIAYIAGREHEDIAALVLEAASQVGERQLRSETFRLAETFTSASNGANEVWPGILINKKLSPPYRDSAERSGAVIVLVDALEPEQLDEEALVTESGFKAHMEQKKQFLLHLQKLAALKVALVAIERGADPEAEQFCEDNGIMLLQRVAGRDLQRLCEMAEAKPLRRSALKKPADELAASLGQIRHIRYDETLGQVRLSGGSGRSFVTAIVTARTKDVAGEKLRIAKDAAAAVQAAFQSGYVPGGGTIELALSRELERRREAVTGMEGFGMEAAAQALRKPFSQIVTNAGFNPLEKVEEARAAQLAEGIDSIGIDCDTGKLIDCEKAGIVDPSIVKLHALQAAGEVAGAVLRIQTVVKMKTNHDG
ncbi:TCP-1/cpn60 chaperonin family protein [Paenibacillus sp. MBLB4367]|uniref:TCP-1/cpn60 chaperonin family protein n=1 Tax=Paenibacillus sp. MBLB4367 TaxID=3384767 RepID=UPI00390820CD